MAQQESDPRLLIRKIQPHTDVKEPRLWFREVLLVRSPNQMESKDNEVRRIHMRPGLNILWAEPEPVPEDVEMYRNGFAGHATGKTLFCRILRHMLGEDGFATKAQTRAIGMKFVELYCLCEIRVAGETWTVGRPLAGSVSEFAVKGRKLEQVLQSGVPVTGYGDFGVALNGLCPGEIRKQNGEEAWRQLRPWLTRDQEARFADLTTWRHSLSEADNPKCTKGDRHMLLRKALGLFSATELKYLDEIEASKRKQETLQEDLKEQDRATRQELKTLGHLLRNVQNLGSIPLIGQEYREWLQREIARKESELKAKKADTFLRLHQEDTFTESEKEIARIETRLEDLEAEIEDLEKHYQEQLALVEAIRNGNVIDGERAAKGFCPRSLKTAQERRCVEPPSEDSNLSKLNLEEVLRNAEVRKEKHDRLKEEEKTLKIRKTRLMKQRETRLAEKKLAWSKAQEPDPELSADIQSLRNGLEILELWEKSHRAHEKNNNDLTCLTVEQGQLKIQLQLEAHEVRGQVKKFSAIYQDVIQALLGLEVEAEVKILADNQITLTAHQTGELGGAALETVKILAFDLAAVIYGFEGRCDHPCFLIHDGPREADMARIAYNQLFRYALKMEKATQSEIPLFQYILTTTTPPPNDMQAGSDWLLCGGPLSGQRDGDKLLRKGF